ncbi:pleiotropic drug resistance ABC transporter [Cylindrobasidium torrendii FP15055 ss-10]|uniref:Pleiotropic drug resistance ABC transporter n=1 Tax=Cylindrobasidium torrendii FP15055 ss-10 TaxID=1314674 RepID=A0A0D7BSX2_9AGAR|nr:pleiotropic drug resistance ABC transporter [Cylindrobasidium torrendii FP15055 ss-10]
MSKADATTQPGVAVDFFDPGGVDNLRRTLSQQSHTAHRDSNATLDAGSFNIENVLQDLLRRRDDKGFKTRSLGVAFSELAVVGLGSSTAHQPTIASVLDPRNLVHVVQNVLHPPTRTILDGFEGVVRPGEMLLVLGRPGSGCSTLLKTLTNQRGEYHAVHGNVRYDALSSAQVESHYRGDVQYSPEDDVLFPSLTVQNTVEFAAKTRAPRDAGGIATSTSEYVKTVTDILITVFGLNHARDTPIGNASIRGVSGGEKKRVAICEALATRSRIVAWDNSTRGLDASTALEFSQALRIATNMLNMSTIASLYQVSESIYQQFDKVCVIYAGKMAYYGPAQDARQYFIDLGYEPAPRQTTADFLTAVTDPLARIPRSGHLNPPRTAVEFSKHFKASPEGHQNAQSVQDYFAAHTQDHADNFKQSARAEKSTLIGKSTPYTLSLASQARAVIIRRVQIVRGDLLTVIFNLATFVLIAIIIGTLFLRTEETTSAFFSRGGILFFVLLFAVFQGMNEIPALFAQRLVISRHHRAAMYHPFIEALAHTIVDIPISLVSIILFGVIVYFLCRLQQTAGQFFIFLVYTFVSQMTMKAWFRGIAAASKSDATAQSAAGVSVLALGLFTGYTTPKPSMNEIFKWITVVNPLKYAFEGLMGNEFHTLVAQCTQVIPQGPGYENITLANQVCATVGSIPGQSFVDGSRFLELSYQFSFDNVWKNFGLLWVFWVIYGFIQLLLSEFNTGVSGQSSTLLFRQGARSLTKDTYADEESKGDLDASSAIEYPPSATEKRDVKFDQSNVFSWDHINYTVDVAGGQRQLLTDVSGYVQPGRITALMGESGAGKTTLLNVLAQRAGSGVIGGGMYVNGQALPADFQAQTGYAQQMDTHVAQTTVREALLFSAKLRQPESVPLAEKEAYVDECMRLCGLEEFTDAIAGSLDVEQRKRLTIGVELAAKPKLLLFLDEPTTGVDAQSASGVLRLLRNLADAGQAILCTIHQPSADLFNSFDRILLLQKGGKTVYFGDLGDNAATLIDYFESNGGRQCKPEENPAEYMLEVIGAGATAKVDHDWHQIWTNSKTCEEARRELEEIHKEGRKSTAIVAEVHTEFTTRWGYQCVQLVKRSMLAQWRDPTYLVAKLFLNIVAGLFIGLTFKDAPNSQQGTQNKIFVLFIAIVLSLPLGSQIQVPFVNLRSVYEIRERPSRMYEWSAFVTSQLLAEIPWNILGSGFLFLTLYFLVGLPLDRAGYTYLMLGIVFPLYYSSFFMAITAMVPRADLAAVLSVPFFAFVLIFNGVLQPFSQMNWWKWMYRLSPYTYFLEGILGNALGRQEIQCADLEYVTLQPPSGMSCGDYMGPFMSFAGGYLRDSDAVEQCSFCPFRSTDQLLESKSNIFYDHRWRNFGLMIVYIAFNVTMVYTLTWLFRIQTSLSLRRLRTALKR